MSNWRYGCVRRTYQTVLPDGEVQQEILYELAEVYPSTFGYTQEGVSIAVDYNPDRDNKKELARWLRLAADDVEKYDLIEDPNVKVTEIGKKDD